MSEPGLPEKLVLTGGALFANVGHWVADVNAMLLLGINVAVAGSWLFSVVKAVKKNRKPPEPPALPRLPDK